MKKKMLNQLVTVLMSLLIVFIAIPMEASAESSTGFFAGKYGKAQVFDVQRSPAYPTPNQPFTVYSFKNIYDSILRTTIYWGANNDRYVQFVDSATQPSSFSNAYSVKLNLYEADGTLVKTISNYGPVVGLADEGFLYEGHDYYGYFISNKIGYPYGSSLTYTPPMCLVTKIDDLNNYAATTTVLKVGETAANAEIEAAKGLLPTSLTAEEDTDTNLLSCLNAISGMSATGVTLSLESENTNVASDGTINYTSSIVTGNVTIKINKTDGTERSQIIAVTVPAHISAADRANAAIAAAKALLPVSFTAMEGRTVNMLTSLNAITGMSATGTTLTIESANANVTNDGTISYTGSAVTGDVTVKINKTNGTEESHIIAVTISAQANTEQISGDYVLIVNESLTDAQQIGTISFDNTNPFGSSNVMQALSTLSVNEDVYQQIQIDDHTIPFGSSGEIQGLSENEDGLTFNTQAVTKTYTIGETKNMLYPTNKFTVRGIGAHCVIWMDDDVFSEFTTPESLDAAIASIIDSYDNNAYPALQTLGADTKMYYADGSGKMSIFIQGASTSPYYSYYDMTDNGITGIHISASGPSPDLSKYTLAIAHEAQHALNDSTQKMSTWINEGLSVAIMHDVSYKMNNYQYDYVSLSWLDQCIQDIRVKSGAGLARVSTVGNSYIDYSIPYLYLRYLSNQVNEGYKYDSDFFSKLYSVDASTSGLTGISRDAYIIEQVLKQYDCFKNPDGSHWSFQQSFANFRIAAFKQDDRGIYGFYGDTTVAHNFGIGGAALYFNAADKYKTIEPTGAIIVKTLNGSFDIPSDAGADIKFIPFDVADQLPANRLNKWYAGGEMNTIYKDREITFDNLRVVKLDQYGNYGQVYQGLSWLDDAELRLVAYSPNDIYQQTPIPYTLGALPTNIPDGSKLMICDPSYNYYKLVYLGKAIVKDIYVNPQDFFTVLDADNSLLTFNNDPNFPWLGSLSTTPTYVMSDFRNKTGATGFTATITIPKNATAKLKFEWTTSVQVFYGKMEFYINDELKNSISGNLYGPGTANVWNYTGNGITNSYDLSGGDAGRKYTFKWVYSQKGINMYTLNTGYVRNIAITDLVLPTVTLQSITAPTAITGLANGTAKTAAALGLPSTVTLVTSDGSVSAPVTWELESSRYDASATNAQIFMVNGIVTLPSGIENTKSVALTTSIRVTVNDVSGATIDECFIATAAFGSKFQPAVTLLRHFRDEYLLTNSVGIAFVKFYYRNSPAIANYIAGSEGLKGLTRVLLAPFIAVVYLIYNPFLAFVLVLICLAGVVVRRRMVQQA